MFSLLLKDLISDFIFDYNKTTFTFVTIFHRPPFSYCTCKCGIALENLEFIDESGGINEDVLERVVDCITKGECRHVKNVPREYVGETVLYALYIVATFGSFEESEKSFNKESEDHFSRYGSLLHMGTYEIAMLRQGLLSPVLHRGNGFSFL